jgi:hypothetical protein
MSVVPALKVEPNKFSARRVVDLYRIAKMIYKRGRFRAL